jgi:hypothetical protein
MIQVVWYGSSRYTTYDGLQQKWTKLRILSAGGQCRSTAMAATVNTWEEHMSAAGHATATCKQTEKH